MSYQSKYTGAQIEALLGQVQDATALTNEEIDTIFEQTLNTNN